MTKYEELTPEKRSQVRAVFESVCIQEGLEGRDKDFVAFLLGIEPKPPSANPGKEP